MTTADFLLEVRCEEIPAHMLRPGVRELGTRLFEELMASRLAPSEVYSSFTPRRLVVVLKGLEQREPDREEELTGPPASVAYDADGNPTAALEGFAKKCGVTASELSTVETAKGSYLVATRRVVGRSTAAVLAGLVPEILRQISWPKTMHWGVGQGPWVRPVHSIVALLDGEIVPFELFGVASGRTTIGHPLHSPEPIQVSGVEDYEAKLDQRGIVVDYETRRTALLTAMETAAREAEGILVPDDALLDKLALICEIPGVVSGELEGVELPREVLITSLRDHQSALTVEREGQLLPLFLTVMDRADDPEGRVERGNEWVVAARLADAHFFFQEDRKRSLEERRSDLERVTFHEKLGSYRAKAERIVALSEFLCAELGRDDVLSTARRTAGLLKVDLTTEMVKEFTSLQGIMGGVYARQEGLPEELWQGIYDQYLPAAASDPIPRHLVGQIVSLADRFDTLVGMFGSGFVPTGSKDPFGLRRAAQGAVRILLEAEIELDLEAILLHAIGLYGERLEASPEEVVAALQPFLLDRVRYVLSRKGFAHDEIEASLAVSGANLPDFERRVEALHEIRGEADFLDAVLAAKRIANILRGAEGHELDRKRLQEPAEIALAEAASRLESTLDQTEANKAHKQGLGSIAEFAPVLDRFFVDVMVMDEDPEVRANRLALLQWIEGILSRAADLTEMVVERSDRRGAQ